jgi:DnaJ domain
MATVFGKGLRGRKKPEATDEVAQIADEANLWWTRRDFVQHAVVRNRRTPETDPAPAVGRPAVDDPGRDPTPGGMSFSQVFTTESLFEGDPAAWQRPAGAPRDATTGAAPRASTPSVEPPPPAAAPANPVARRRLAANHPLVGPLETLGLDTDASWIDVQHAYRARAKEAHPDRTGDSGTAMAELNAAYTALRDGRRYGIFGDD